MPQEIINILRYQTQTIKRFLHYPFYYENMLIRIFRNFNRLYIAVIENDYFLIRNTTLRDQHHEKLIRMVRYILGKLHAIVVFKVTMRHRSIRGIFLLWFTYQQRTIHFVAFNINSHIFVFSLLITLGNSCFSIIFVSLPYNFQRLVVLLIITFCLLCKHIFIVISSQFLIGKRRL